MLTAPLQMQAFEYRRRMPGGVTLPLLMAARDAEGHQHEVVVKLRHPDVAEGPRWYGPSSCKWTRSTGVGASWCRIG